MTSRGCPFRCIYCSHSMGSDWRPRSAENVVREIQWQVQELGVKEICIYDDNFSLDKARASEICDLLIESNTRVCLQFTNGLRVDCLDEKLLQKMKDAGTWLIGIAPETGNVEVMKRIRKGFRHQRVLEIREACRRLQITTFGFFMIGFPFDSRQTIEETISFAEALDCEIVEFNKVIPYPKTELYDIAARENCLLPSQGRHLSSSYHDGEITTHRVGDLDPSEIKLIIKKAYRRYYLRPRKIADLLASFSISDLMTLSRYALTTGNI
ncbi:B12-binding domain-containing radical SAM protein [Acidobacteriota bacterium]